MEHGAKHQGVVSTRQGPARFEPISRYCGSTLRCETHDGDTLNVRLPGHRLAAWLALLLETWEGTCTAGVEPDVDVVVVGQGMRPDGVGGRRLLIVDDCSLSAAAAKGHVVAGRASGAVTVDECPETFLMSMAAVGRGLSTISSGVRALSAQLPEVGGRSLRVLTLVRAGLTNEAIARRCEVSTATVKRDLKTLFEIFGVVSRTELVTVATGGEHRDSVQ